MKVRGYDSASWEVGVLFGMGEGKGDGEEGEEGEGQREPEPEPEFPPLESTASAPYLLRPTGVSSHADPQRHRTATF